MPLDTSLLEPGDLVSYGDMANPRTTYRVAGFWTPSIGGREIVLEPAVPGDGYRHTSDCRQHGWTLELKAPGPIATAARRVTRARDAHAYAERTATRAAIDGFDTAPQRAAEEAAALVEYREAAAAFGLLTGREYP